jgi:hypothetical protein
LKWGVTDTPFKGCVYISKKYPEAVVTFQGTVFCQNNQTKGGDLLADLQVALGGLVGMLPQDCSAALRLFERTSAVYPNRQISFTGHSLGGGLAQVMGHWTGLPFVTFNAPGMWGDIQRSKVVFIWQPWHTGRSWVGTFKRGALAKQSASTGRNFRNVLDPVSAYGMHYGPVTRFWRAGGHFMTHITERLRKSRWATVNPFDPASKEWGELD